MYALKQIMLGLTATLPKHQPSLVTGARAVQLLLFMWMPLVPTVLTKVLFSCSVV